ncbi:GGDEF domain-containing protein [Deinococcus aquatilis]|uniref:GGDEF domain-containing protein n=1 Tax=Deinococcus aquatilis TaxID=519440 RepID=UPI00059050FC|nr:GGDEF domain-containing protein [Deinococcus aquatilis]
MKSSRVLPASEGERWTLTQRRMFMVLTLLGTLGVGAALWVQAPNFDPLDRVALPLLALLLICLDLSLTLHRISLRLAFRMIYIATSAYFLLALNQQFRVFVPVYNALSENTYWFAVLYASAFLTFPARRAVWVAGGLFGLSALICGVHLYQLLLNGPNPRLVGAVAQYLLGGGVMVAVQATFSFQRTQLLAARAAAYTDALTGLANRRAAEEHLAALYARREPFTLVLFDLDHFKSVNDQHGHATGDLVLKGVSKAASSHLPPDGLAARWGGEEFLLVLPPLPALQVRAMLDLLRAQLHEQRYGAVGGLTASFGVATARPGDHPDDILTRADAAMYVAKRQGRNDVRMAELRRTQLGSPPSPTGNHRPDA